jgi:hypothetical protein
MEEPENFVELEDVTTSETESISPTRIEEETINQRTGASGSRAWKTLMDNANPSS